MQSKVSPLSPVLVQVEVQVPWDKVQEKYDENLTRLSRTVHVRGFRPGKAPRTVIKRLYGQRVHGEVAANFIEEGLSEAVRSHDLDIVSEPTVELSPLEDGQPLQITAKFEIRPEISEVKVEGLELSAPAAEVSDKDVNEAVEELRRQHAELRLPEPARASQAGDQLRISYGVEIEGKAREDMASEERTVTVGEDKLIPELDKALLGVNVGDHLDVDVRFGEQAPEELRGKDARFHIHIHEIREAVLPELDDDFAKDCGDYETLLELRLKIREGLENEKKANRESELRRQVIDRLVDANEVPVPPSLVERQRKQLEMEIGAFLAMAGQGNPSLQEEMSNSLRERAEKQVKAALLLSALARQEGTKVEESEIDQRLQRIADASGKHIAKVRAEFGPERRQRLESQLVEEKLLDWLVAKAVVRTAEADSAEA